MKTIAVLMMCYNRVGTTLECLQRLFAQELPEGFSFDVWLVDAASPDRTGEVVRLKYPMFDGALSSQISDYNLVAGRGPGGVVGTCLRDSRGETLEYEFLGGRHAALLGDGTVNYFRCTHSHAGYFILHGALT